jgi:hypothetical protein
MIEFFVISFLLVLIFITFMVYKKEKHNQKQEEDYELLERVRKDVSKLHPRISKLSFFSSDETYVDYKTMIYICLKNENGKYYDYNMIIEAAIHECAHALSPIYDDKHQTPEFKTIFKYLLNRAEELKIYDSKKPHPPTYCGVCLGDCGR